MLIKLETPNWGFGNISKRTFISSIPMHVVEVANKNHQFSPRTVAPPWYVFVFRTLEMLAAISGILLLVAGGVLANSLLIGGGASILGGLIAGEGYCFFSSKKAVNKIEPPMADLVPSVPR